MRRWCGRGMSAAEVEAVAALEGVIERAAAEGQGLRAAAAGIVLGVLLERSRPPWPARVREAMRTLDVAATLDRPLALRDAWSP